MKTKTFIAIIISFALILFTSSSFATNDMMNNMGNGVQNVLSNAGNGIRNVINGTGNVVENMASGIGEGINNMTNDNENNTANETTNDTFGGLMTDDNNNNSYNATRTATTGNTTNATFLGMNATAWGWLIMGIVGAAIVGLVWFYGKQHEDGYTPKHDDNY